jgi:hypothetical protein
MDACAFPTGEGQLEPNPKSQTLSPKQCRCGKTPSGRLSLSQTLNPKPEAVQMREDAKWAPELPLKKKDSFNKGTGTAPSAVRTQASTVYVVLEAVKSANTASPVICGLIRLVHPGRTASFCGLLDGNRISAGEYGFDQRTIKAKVESHEMEMAQVSIENLVTIPNTKPNQTKPNQTKSKQTQANQSSVLGCHSPVWAGTIRPQIPNPKH